MEAKTAAAVIPVTDIPAAVPVKALMGNSAVREMAYDQKIEST